MERALKFQKFSLSVASNLLYRELKRNGNFKVVFVRENVFDKLIITEKFYYSSSSSGIIVALLRLRVLGSVPR